MIFGILKLGEVSFELAFYDELMIVGWAEIWVWVSWVRWAYLLKMRLFWGVFKLCLCKVMTQKPKKSTLWVTFNGLIKEGTKEILLQGDQASWVQIILDNMKKLTLPNWTLKLNKIQFSQQNFGRLLYTLPKNCLVTL